MTPETYSEKYPEISLERLLEKPLGSVIQGSLTQGLEIRLHADISVEEMRVGKFLVVRGRKARFFCMLTDVSLGTSSLRIIANPPEPDDDFLREVLAGSGTYGTINLTPMLMFIPALELENQLFITNGDTRVDANQNGKNRNKKSLNSNTNGKAPLGSMQTQSSSEMQLLPVKTIPSHFSPVYEATEHDFRSVFGWEDDPTRRNFAIGQPLDMDVPVCLDLDRFVERSNGVFGKSGTGKSFLTRLLLSGIIRRQAAVNLIFDMHSEYGWEAVSEGKSCQTVKGLRQLFPHQVEVYTLDPESAKRRGIKDAQELYLSFDQIEIEDINLVRGELNLSEASLDNANILYGEFGKHWITRLIAMTNEDITEFCDEKRGHKGSIMALQRKLMRLENLKYIRSASPHNYVERILQSLEAKKKCSN